MVPQSSRCELHKPKPAAPVYALKTAAHAAADRPNAEGCLRPGNRYNKRAPRHPASLGRCTLPPVLVGLVGLITIDRAATTRPPGFSVPNSSFCAPSSSRYAHLLTPPDADTRQRRQRRHHGSSDLTLGGDASARAGGTTKSDVVAERRQRRSATGGRATSYGWPGGGPSR